MTIAGKITRRGLSSAIVLWATTASGVAFAQTTNGAAPPQTLAAYKYQTCTTSVASLSTTTPAQAMLAQIATVCQQQFTGQTAHTCTVTAAQRPPSYLSTLQGLCAAQYPTPTPPPTLSSSVNGACTSVSC